MLHPARKNRLLNTIEMRQRRLELRSMPYSIQIEVTTKCNLACIMCARDKYHGRGENLDDDILDLVMRQVFPTAQDVIVSSFGEPLLYPRFREIVDSIQPESGLELGFFTNLLLLDDESAEQLVQRGVGYVNVSIDGASKETYEHIRAGGKWETLLEKLQLLQDVKRRHDADKPVMNLCVVGSTLNIHETAAFIDLAHRFGFDSVKYNPNLYVDDEEMEYLSLVHEQEKAVRQFEAGYRRAIELDMHSNYHEKPFGVKPANRSRPPRDPSIPGTQYAANVLKRIYRTGLGWRIENTWRQSGGDRGQFARLFLRKLRDYTIDHIPGIGWVRRKPPIPHVIPNDAPPKTCGNPWTHVHVKSDGLVYPCCFSDEVMGDLRRQSFEEIWNSPKYRDLRRSLSTGKYWASCRRASCNWVEGRNSTEYGCQIQPLTAVNGMDGGRGIEIPVRVRNTGKFNWLPPIYKKKPIKEPVSISYRLFNEFNDLVDEGNHVPISEPVKPGKTIDLTLPIRPVRYGGKLKLKIDLVHEGVTWFGERGNNALEIEFEVRNVPFAAYLGAANKHKVTSALAGPLVPGSRFEIPIRVRNVGTEPLGAESEKDFISSHWRRSNGEIAEWEGPRAEIAEALAPGKERTVQLPIEVPRALETGRYDLEIDVVRADEMWLGIAWNRPLLAYPVRVEAEPGAAALLPTRDERGKLFNSEPKGQCVANAGNKGIW